MTAQRRQALTLAVAALLATAPAVAQFAVPEIRFESVEPLKFPENIHLGEDAGVATNSKGDLFSIPAPAIQPFRSAPRGHSRTAARGCFNSTGRASSCGRSERTPTA
jgi:hypothetical protein